MVNGDDAANRGNANATGSGAAGAATGAGTNADATTLLLASNALQNVLVGIREFDGRTTLLKDFIQDAKNGSVYIPEGQRPLYVRAVLGKLKGSARDCTVDKEFPTLDSLFKTLKKRFTPGKDFNYYSEKIHQIRMNRNDTIGDFYDHLVILLAGAKNALREEFGQRYTDDLMAPTNNAALKIFIKRLPADISLTVNSQKPENLEAAYEEAVRLECQRETGNIPDTRYRYDPRRERPSDDFHTWPQNLPPPPRGNWPVQPSAQVGVLAAGSPDGDQYPDPSQAPPEPYPAAPDSQQGQPPMPQPCAVEPGYVDPYYYYYYYPQYEFDPGCYNYDPGYQQEAPAPMAIGVTNVQQPTEQELRRAHETLNQGNQPGPLANGNRGYPDPRSYGYPPQGNYPWYPNPKQWVPSGWTNMRPAPPNQPRFNYGPRQGGLVRIYNPQTGLYELPRGPPYYMVPIGNGPAPPPGPNRSNFAPNEREAHRPGLPYRPNEEPLNSQAARPQMAASQAPNLTPATSERPGTTPAPKVHILKRGSAAAPLLHHVKDLKM